MKEQKQPPFDPKIIRAIIGLGNPGNKYYKTRHNIGFRIADELVRRCTGSWRSKPLMEHAEIKLSEDMYSFDAAQVMVIKPLTFMNSSGKVVPYLLKKGIKAENILVVHDELEKKFGHLSAKIGGSARGHNGLRSIIDIIGKDFWRLRFGIGRPEDRDDVGDYVLRNFTMDEEQEIPVLMGKSLDILLGLKL